VHSCLFCLVARHEIHVTIQVLGGGMEAALPLAALLSLSAEGPMGELGTAHVAGSFTTSLTSINAAVSLEGADSEVHFALFLFPKQPFLCFLRDLIVRRSSI